MKTDKTITRLSTIVALQDMIIRRLKKPATAGSIGSLEERANILKERVNFKKLREHENSKD